MDRKGAPPDAQVAAIATRQHGVVSLNQLRSAGLTDAAVQGREKAGRLHRLHRGVYAVGHTRLTFRGCCMAGVLAAEGCVISHRSAAALWELLPPTRMAIEVSAPLRSGRKKRPGIVVHRPRLLPQSALTSRHGIPVTTPARTLSDLRSVAAPQVLRRAVRQAEVLGLELGPDLEGDRTRSELERAFLRLCRREGLPTPGVNVRVGPYVVDFLWREQALIVETDGYRYHRGRAAFETDRARDLALRALGFEVVRLSHRQVTREPRQVARVLRRTLGGAPSGGY